MSDLQNLTQRIIAFRDDRNWKQFHNPKDMAISLSLEASEVLEHFQWRNGTEMAEHVSSKKEELADELCDVLYWVLLMSHDTNIDLIEAFERKMKKNELKYPIDKAKDTPAKYTDL